MIADLSTRIEEAEPETNAETELYLTQVRTLGQLAGKYRLLIRDTDLDEMQDELDLIKQAQAVREDR